MFVFLLAMKTLIAGQMEVLIAPAMPDTVGMDR